MRYVALLLIIASASSVAQVTSTTTCSPRWNGDVRCETTMPPGHLSPQQYPALAIGQGDNESFLAGAHAAVMQRQAQQIALQNQILQQQLMSDPNYQRVQQRNYANDLANKCQKRHRRNTDKELECLAERYRVDGTFAVGFSYLLEEFPPDQANWIRSEVEMRAKLQADTAVERWRSGH